MRRALEETLRPRRALARLLAAAALLAWTGPGWAQTDYYNLDKDRPLRVEDAYAAETYAFEIQLAPLTLAEHRDLGVAYTPSLELKYSAAPGLEAGAGVTFWRDRFDEPVDAALAELEITALYNLNVETLGVPAFGVRLTGHLPLDGDHGPSLEVRGIATRTLAGPVRAHVNAAAVLGGDAAEEWWLGAAVDYVLPFISTLLLAETFAARPRREHASLRVHSSAGVRYQASPRVGFDAGVGRSWTGAERRDWRLTLGMTSALGVRSLTPIP